MDNVIACRIASYGEYQECAWWHLPRLGIRHVEIPVPAAAELPSVHRRLQDHGLEASSLQARCDVTDPAAVEIMRPQLQACKELGSRICFLSAKAGSADRAQVFARLRAIGDAAADLGITVALETHPDLITNGTQAQETMKSIDHPNIRVNFDTANVYFYNEGTTAVRELQVVADYVTSVHLKDTTGGYQEWNFPALGTGVVDFPRVFELLNRRGFRGPFTMELEGTKGIRRSQAEQLQYIEQSTAYLRQIAAFRT